MMVQAALNVLGSVHVAAFTAANKIEQVVTQVYVALGTTMATYCAQNMGAGKVKRISRASGQQRSWAACIRSCSECWCSTLVIC